MSWQRVYALTLKVQSRSIHHTVHVCATDQSDASFMPFLAASRLSPRSKPANTIDPPIFIPLPDCLALSHSVNHHQKATEETRSKKKSISALLIHSLPSRTQSSPDKSPDGNYLCGWYAARAAGQTRVLTSSFRRWKHLCRFTSRRFWGVISPLSPFQGAPSMKDHFHFSKGMKKWIWKQAKGCTSISHWRLGVDNQHSWSKSTLKVFLWPQGIL